MAARRILFLLLCSLVGCGATEPPSGTIRHAVVATDGARTVVEVPARYVRVNLAPVDQVPLEIPIDEADAYLASVGAPLSPEVKEVINNFDCMLHYVLDADRGHIAFAIGEGLNFSSRSGENDRFRPTGPRGTERGKVKRPTYLWRQFMKDGSETIFGLRDFGGDCGYSDGDGCLRTISYLKLAYEDRPFGFIIDCAHLIELGWQAGGVCSVSRDFDRHSQLSYRYCALLLPHWAEIDRAMMLLADRYIINRNVAPEMMVREWRNTKP